MLREKLKIDAVNEVVDEAPDIAKDPVALVNRCYDRFINKQVEHFADYCKHAYEVNAMAMRQLEKEGIRGKYTDSVGWSKDGSMLHKYIVPKQLSLFMSNLIDAGFWADTNKKVRDSFMKQICRGGTRYDYEQLLKKVLAFYGKDIKRAESKSFAI